MDAAKEPKEARSRLYLALGGDASMYGFEGVNIDSEGRTLVYTGKQRTEGGVTFTVVTLESATYVLHNGWIDIFYQDSAGDSQIMIPAQHVRAVRKVDV